MASSIRMTIRSGSVFVQSKSPVPIISMQIRRAAILLFAMPFHVFFLNDKI